MADIRNLGYINRRVGMVVQVAQVGSFDAFKMRLDKRIEKAARLSVNYAARRGRTMAARAIRQEKRFPPGYVNERMYITQFATGDNLLAIITARYRPTQLVRFGARQLTRRAKTVPRRNAGISVHVNRDSSRKKIPGAFFIALNAGREGTKSFAAGANRGVAVQLPGRRLNSKGNPKFKVLYSSSVHNAFFDVRPDIEEPVQELLTVEFNRQMARGRK